MWSYEKNNAGKRFAVPQNSHIYNEEQNLPVFFVKNLKYLIFRGSKEPENRVFNGLNQENVEL